MRVFQAWFTTPPLNTSLPTGLDKSILHNIIKVMDKENNANRGDLINSPESSASPGTVEEVSETVRQSDLDAVKKKSEERLQELQEKIALSEEQIKNLMGER